MTSICTNFSIWRQNKQKHDVYFLTFEINLFLTTDSKNWDEALHSKSNATNEYIKEHDIRIQFKVSFKNQILFNNISKVCI